LALRYPASRLSQLRSPAAPNRALIPENRLFILRTGRDFQISIAPKPGFFEI
jgi:hypothetical protein